MHSYKQIKKMYMQQVTLQPIHTGTLANRLEFSISTKPSIKGLLLHSIWRVGNSPWIMSHSFGPDSLTNHCALLELFKDGIKCSWLANLRNLNLLPILLIRRVIKYLELLWWVCLLSARWLTKLFDMELCLRLVRSKLAKLTLIKY